MLSSNDYLLYRLIQERYQDLIREAEKESLVRCALSNRVQHTSLFKQAFCWLGNRFIAVGQNLLQRSETVQNDFAPAATNLAK
jgi:hypothetical protein